ncbi:hypothetical protein GTA08_BOTSDO08895 [Neofusicoccum parvum]|nr:hypothetical protein GTA08_BOTSDO08895 [Neofusicoccum parvum]
MTQLKVLICGGGIAGNALAVWLSRLGHDVTIIERFPSLRATGLQIDLRGHGIEVMRRMGLEQQFRAKSVDEQGLAIVDGAGRQWAFFPANRSGKGAQSFTTDYEIMRGDLCQLLHDATKGRVRYVFGSSLESFEESDNSVEARFSDGKTERYDLIVGADGQGSRTRKLMFGPGAEEDCFHSLGAYIAYFTIPRPAQEGEKFIGTMYMAPGKRSLFVRRHNSHSVQAYLICVADSERLRKCQKGDVNEEKGALTELFRGAGWQSDWILKSMENADDFYCERLGVVKLDAWSSGRTTLVGDAGYCPSATTGMGTSSALVGAYILAGEIGRHCGHPGRNGTKDELAMALKEYEQKFRPFMDQVQRGLSRESSPWQKFPSSWLAIAILNFLLAVACFLRLEVFATWFLREEVEGWTLPDYKELVDGEE